MWSIKKSPTSDKMFPTSPDAPWHVAPPESRMSRSHGKMFVGLHLGRWWSTLGRRSCTEVHRWRVGVGFACAPWPYRRAGRPQRPHKARECCYIYIYIIKTSVFFKATVMLLKKNRSTLVCDQGVFFLPPSFINQGCCSAMTKKKSWSIVLGSFSTPRLCCVVIIFLFLPKR